MLLLRSIHVAQLHLYFSSSLSSRLMRPGGSKILHPVLPNRCWQFFTMVYVIDRTYVNPAIHRWLDRFWLFWQEFSSPTQNDFCVPSASANKLHPLCNTIIRLPNVQRLRFCAEKWDEVVQMVGYLILPRFHDDFCIPCLPLWRSLHDWLCVRAYIKQP